MKVRIPTDLEVPKPNREQIRKQLAKAGRKNFKRHLIEELKNKK